MASLTVKSITVLLIVVLSFSLVVSGIGPLESKAWASSGESIGVGALVVLGVWGGYKLFSNHRAEKYADYLEKGKEYLASTDYALALKSLEQAKKIEDSLAVNQLLTEARTKYQKYHYQQGSAYLKDKNWELAYQEFKRVEKYGAYLNSNQKLTQAYQQLRQEKLKRVLVLTFSDNDYQYDFGTRITGFLVSDLLAQEPDFLEIKEEDLAYQGLITASEAQKIGGQVTADLLVTGKVITGQVDQQKVRDTISQEDGSEVTQIRVEKRAYSEAILKLVDLKDGRVVLSKSFSERENYQESYLADETEVIKSDEELLNQTLKKIAQRFSNLLIKKYEIIKK